MASTHSRSWLGPAGDSGPILVAVDFAPDSEAALLWGAGLAASLGAGLVILHVIHDPAEAPGSYHGKESDPLRPMDEVAQAMMDDFLDRLRSQDPHPGALDDAETVLVEGLPETRIPEIAEAKAARMIVMGSRGHRGLQRLLLGSKAEHVVRVARLPVTIVKANSTADES